MSNYIEMKSQPKIKPFYRPILQFHFLGVLVLLISSFFVRTIQITCCKRKCYQPKDSMSGTSLREKKKSISRKHLPQQNFLPVDIFSSNSVDQIKNKQEPSHSQAAKVLVLQPCDQIDSTLQYSLNWVIRPTGIFFLLQLFFIVLLFYSHTFIISF